LVDNREKKQLRHFFRNVTHYLGIDNWNIEFCHDSYCWLNNRIITIDQDYSNDLRQLILHEISHIQTAKYCNQKHNPDFWKMMERLTYKFMRCPLDFQQQKHREYMSQGYYSLKYKN
jgi:hypothetical protein